jgi:hypothetical protein
VEFVWVEKLGESEVEEGIGESIEAGPTERFLFTLVVLVGTKRRPQSANESGRTCNLTTMSRTKTATAMS